MTRLLVLLMVLLMLTGCGCGDNAALRAEIERLREDLAAQEGRRQAEIDALSRAASVTAACDWLVPVCPDSMTALGRSALEAGYGPDRLSLVLMTAKLCLLLLPVGLASGLAGWAWAQWSRPALRQAAEARALLAEAEQRQARARAEIERLQAIQAAQRAEIEAAKEELAELQEEQQRLRDAIERLRQIRDGLTGL